MDAEPGRVVPVFALTAGRAHSRGPDLPLESLVTTIDDEEGPPGVDAGGADTAADMSGEFGHEQRVILGLAAEPVSIFEVAAHLRVPVGVARVLVGDLAAAGRLTVHRPRDLATPVDPAGDPGPRPTGGARVRDGRPDPEILVKLLEGLRVRSR